jgi:secreted trypsin-like serine protease
MKKTMKASMHKLVGSSLVTLALIGCGDAPQNNSETKVTNGREVADSTYPSVVLLVFQSPEGQGICTGTFINDSQVISAGHCVDGLSTDAPEVVAVTKEIENGEEKYYAIAKAVSYKRHPSYNIRLGVSPYDLSVIDFPANSAPATSALIRQPPRTGDTLTIVGYGNNESSLDANGEQTGSGAGTKRVGTNKVGSVTGGFINFVGLAGADGVTAAGSFVSSGSGDSGGPLFVNGAIAGITSGGGLRNDSDGTLLSTSKYVDVNSRFSRSFLATVVKTPLPAAM